MLRSFWFKLLLVLLVLGALGYWIYGVRQSDLTAWQMGCGNAEMIIQLTNFKRLVIWAVSAVAAICGVICSALLTWRLKKELYSARSGTGGRLLAGMGLMWILQILIAFVLYYASHPCLRLSVAPEANGGLNEGIVNRTFSLIGGLLPVWWLSLFIESLIVGLLMFGILGLVWRYTTSRKKRRRSA